MLYVVLFAAVLVYGVWYAINPMKSLERKYMGDEVPPTAVKTARISGVVIAVCGLVGIVYNIIKLASAG